MEPLKTQICQESSPKVQGLGDSKPVKIPINRGPLKPLTEIISVLLALKLSYLSY